MKMASVLAELEDHVIFRKIGYPHRLMCKGPIYDRVKTNLFDKEKSRYMYGVYASSFYKKTTSDLRKMYLRRNKDDKAPLFPKEIDHNKKNLLYSLPENVQHMIFKISFDNVIKELEKITTIEYTKLTIKRQKLERRHHNEFVAGLKTGMLNMIDNKALKVFMCMKWNIHKWSKRKYQYTNHRNDDYLNSIHFTIEQMLIKAYSCSVLTYDNHITVPRLKWLCRLNGLKVSGKKIELIKRLMSV